LTRSPSSSRRFVTLLLAAGIVTLCGIGNAEAIEGGSSLYVAGTKGIGAAILPSEGVYFSNPLFFYSGKNSGAATYSGILVEGSSTVSSFTYFPTALWVTPAKILGGTTAVGLTGVLGYADIGASGAITEPGKPADTLSLDDAATGIGDPILNGSIGWTEGASSWNLSTMINVPVGQYDTGQLANISFHRWIVDVTGAYTWYDPKIGIDLSAALGFSFNGENEATGYISGNELHMELSAARYLTEAVAVGVNFFHARQITGDSGSGAVLGSYEGHASAIGPEISATFNLGKTPLSVNANYFWELAADNRAQGSSGWLTLAAPLGGAN